MIRDGSLLLKDLFRDWTTAYCEGAELESCLRRAKGDRPVFCCDTQVV